ncbi:MAG: BCCT family transporter, partial [Bryobacterales bacterium]|nr:BCCT family transporter [Bryobacterales bacterium]
GNSASVFFEWLRAGAVSRFDGFLMMAGNAFLVFCLALIVSPMGSIRLGGKEAKPHFSTISWISMLFAAGMGIGLVFYGVSEPLSHFTASIAANAGAPGSSAPLLGAPGNAAASRDLAMAATVFNWSLHPWAIYAVVGLGFAVFTYNFHLPLSLRSVFLPLLGNAVWGLPGDIIDILAVLATLFGLAASLGMGAEQTMAGITYVYGIPGTAASKILLVALMTVVTLLSVCGGIDRGIRRLSELNLVMAALLTLFVLACGPTLPLFRDLFANTMHYLGRLPALSNPFGRKDVDFYDNWSVYFWAWWMSWAPFVGTFMARISRGRTVREFLLGALLAPSLLCIVWLTVFGNTAIDQVVAGDAKGMARAALESQLFILLGTLPYTAITSLAGILLIMIFFVTGWDSGTLVIDCMTSGGHIDTPLRQRVFWLLIVGIIATVLLLVGGLTALQAAAITAGLPLAVVMLVMCLGIVKGLAAIRSARHSTDRTS